MVTQQGCQAVSSVGIVPPKRSLKGLTQRTSHAHLSQDVSGLPAPPARSKSGHLDAIIVPASRPASFLQPVIDLAASLNVRLVLLCSKQTRVEQVAQRVASTPGSKCLIVPIAKGWTHSAFPSRTSEPEFADANGGRESDLSLKRNLGLLLARLHGWNKIAFVDDDIRLSKTDHVARLAGQLDACQVAGMVVSRFPDNSVVCHARRLATLSQDVFLTGAVLGVHCNNLPLSFFPNIYNEDWFFFAEEAATRRLPRVGQAVQEEYDPFASPDRASREEFGDLLAEGLFALFGEGDPSVPFNEQLCGATRTYWDRFIEARRDFVIETSTVLRRFANEDPGNRRICSALASLEAAKSKLDDPISPDLCVSFLDAWRADLGDWQRFSTGVNNVGSTCEAMDFLELKNWRLAEFGAAEVDDLRGSRRFTSPVSV
jgi:hypothetical protein